jgi:hypothetical protein
MRLKKTETFGVYLAEINNKPAVVAMTERNRAKAEFVNASVTIGANKVRAALKLANESGAALYVAVSVSVGGKWKQSYAIPYESFKKWKVGQADFPLNEKAREAYATGDLGVVGFKPEIVEAPKAEAKPKSAKKSAVK